MNLVVFAIPAFFLFLYIEYTVAKARNKVGDIYNYDGSVSNISIGIAERMLDLFIAAAFYNVFEYVYRNFSLFEIPNLWYIWIGLLLAADFVWYWYHRLGHEVNIFWGAHIVHHQSEEFNYTVSARITAFQALIRNCFWCFLPFLGFHPDMVITVLLIHGSYSFFTHTQMIGRVRWLEYVFITPSLHGVHHASNEKYLDKNFGDVFVFWDKLFGTFQPEEEKPVYGLTHPLKSRSFLWQHFHYYIEIAEACRRAKGLGNKIRVLFENPAKMDQDIRPLLEKRFLQASSGKDRKENNFRIYLNLQLAASILLLCWYTQYFEELSTTQKAFPVLIILLTLINCGALLEQRKWIYYLEHFRILLISSWISISIDQPLLTVSVALCLLFLQYIFPMHKWYIRYVLKMHDES